jgi:hypothetical protein
LQLHVLPGQRIDLDLIQGLKREAAGEASSSMTYVH